MILAMVLFFNGYKQMDRNIFNEFHPTTYNIKNRFKIKNRIAMNKSIKEEELNANQARQISQVPTKQNKNDKDVVHDIDNLKMTPEPAENDEAVTIIKTEDEQ